MTVNHGVVGSSPTGGAKREISGNQEGGVSRMFSGFQEGGVEKKKAGNQEGAFFMIFPTSNDVDTSNDDTALIK